MPKKGALPPDAFADLYKDLREQYRSRLTLSAETLEDIIKKSAKRGLPYNTLVKTRQLSHGLAGSGAVFGFSAVTHAAQNLDALLVGILSSLKPDQILPPPESKEFNALVIGLKTACENAQSDRLPYLVDMPDNRSAPAPPVHASPSIVVVDDDKNIRDILSQNLKIKKMDVKTAKNGSDGLAMIRKTKPDLVILDVCMPEMGGHEVMRSMKEDPALRNMPVMILTGEASGESVVSALYRGAIDYVVKPFDLKNILQKIEKIIEGKKPGILIADNDYLLLKLMESKYTACGFQVSLASDGEQAWEMMAGHRFDLITLDLDMPGMNGIEILKKMRKKAETKYIPVIVVSSSNTPDSIAAAIQNGAQQYVGKPFAPDDLIRICFNLLNMDGAKISRAK